MEVELKLTKVDNVHCRCSSLNNVLLMLSWLDCLSLMN